MSENELNEKDEKLENAIPDNDYTMEVKQGFFSKLFNREPKKALPDPNRKVKTTGLSIDFIWKMRTLRADAIEWMESRMDDIKNLFSGGNKAENENKNGFKKQVIGQQEEELSLEDLAEKGPINQIIMPQVRQQQITATEKTLIDNSKTAEDVREEAEELGIEVADLELDEGFEKVPEEKKSEEVQKPTIEVGDIELGKESPNVVKDGKDER